MSDVLIMQIIDDENGTVLEFWTLE
jgi:hypothetical protein